MAVTLAATKKRERMDYAVVVGCHVAGDDYGACVGAHVIPSTKSVLLFVGDYNVSHDKVHETAGDIWLQLREHDMSTCTFAMPDGTDREWKCARIDDHHTKITFMEPLTFAPLFVHHNDPATKHAIVQHLRRMSSWHIVAQYALNGTTANKLAKLIAHDMTHSDEPYLYVFTCANGVVHTWHTSYHVDSTRITTNTGRAAVISHVDAARKIALLFADFHSIIADC